MIELERRALLGDKDAQRECTEKGIVLACPCCGGVGTLHSINQCKDMYGVCTNCGVMTISCKSADQAIEKWNTRPAPPIGRCDDCNHRYENEGNEYECEIHNICPDDNFYCKDFEPKEDKK